MAAVTQLSVLALPGPEQSFTAKTAATISKGSGPFTAQSVIALPGAIPVFSPKTAAGGTEKGLGPFTAISVTALAGARHLFIAKTPYDPPPELVPEFPIGGGGYWGGRTTKYVKAPLSQLKRLNLSQDDQDILEFVAIFVLSQ